MTTWLKWVLSIICLAGLGRADAAVVSLTAPSLVTTVNSEVILDLTIQYDAGEPGSLFSFGARVDLSGSGLTTLVTLTVPSVLDFSGPDGPGALTDLTPGVLGVKGTVEILNPPITPYVGSVLAQYRFHFPEEGEFTFTPRAFNTLGPTEDLFVAGNGEILDDSLTFLPVTIRVIPEPGVGLLCVIGTGLLVSCRRRRAEK